MADAPETRLEICPNCGVHGWIKLADGYTTPNYFSKEEVYTAVSRLLEAHQITIMEAEILDKVAALSTIPYMENPASKQENCGQLVLVLDGALARPAL